MNTRLSLVSAYSFLYGVHKPENLLDRALSLGVKTAAITDLNNLYGVHTFLEAAKERGIRPIIGSALTLNKEQIINNKYQRTNDFIFCYVENREGFSRLCEIITARNMDKENFDPLPLLLENSSGLVLASADNNVLKTLNGKVKHLFAVVSQGNLSAIGAAREFALPLAYIEQGIFLSKDDKKVHRVLRAIDLNKTTGNLKPEDFVPEDSGLIKSSAEIRGFLNSWREAARGTEEISSLCKFDTIFDGHIFPSYGDSPEAELRRRTYEGAVSRYGELGDYEINRIEHELGIIQKMGFSPYFLHIDDIVKMATANRTCGRGSGAASIVSYSLRITNVDPLRHNLYFERFLNTSRPDPPDIDIDFAWDERDELIKAVIERSGSDNCARVANHNFFRSRSALRETAKAYGFTDAEITALERRLQMGEKKEEGRGEVWQEIFNIAKKIEGLPRGMSMHCGGLVITPKPISRYAPVEMSAKGTGSAGGSFPLLAWEKEGTEAAGLVKIDLLGNRSLAVIRDAVRNQIINDKEQIINKKYQIANNKDQMLTEADMEDRLSRAIDDEATINALARGNSMGVFYIESPAMRQLQKKTGRGDFDHIVIHSSIIRPAANKFISEYVNRLKGKKWEPLHPRLENILDESYGILCYQEDVSKAAIALAGFIEADADKLRKVIAKKAGGAKLRVYEDQFFEGCKKNDVPEDTVKKIWAMMLSFDGYSFCKPHSASYAMVSFQAAYLRVHHPAEFMAAVLSNQGGYYRAHAYIAEIRRMGLSTVGPDINTSSWHYNGRGREVNIGFMAIKGLSVSGTERIMEEREKNGNFLSLDDFARRIKLNKDDIIALCPAGVFDSIAEGLPRPMQARRLLSTTAGSKNGELFDNDTPASSFLPPNSSLLPPHSSLLTPTSSLWNEYKALGFLRNLHPLALWKDQIIPLKRIKAKDINKYLGKYITILGWPVTQKDVWTKDGLAMSFLSLEDETAMYETVIFPDIYDKYYKLLFDQHPLVVYGKVMSDQDAVSLEVKKVEQLCG